MASCIQQRGLCEDTARVRMIASTSSAEDEDIDSRNLMFRKRRELRYSRDQEALQRIIHRCRKEMPIHDMQKQALEQIHQQLQLRIADEESYLYDLEKRLESLGSDMGDADASFLDARANAESKLAAVRSDERTLRKQLESFERIRSNQYPFADESEQYHQSSKSRSVANLNLFLQKSPTKRPLVLYSSFHPDSSTRIIGTRDRKSAPELKRRDYNCFIHTRAHSSIENMGNHFNRDQLATTRETKGKKSSDRDGSDSGVLAVDEFANSFSSRVITPLQVHRRRSDSLRRLRLSANKPVQWTFKQLPVPDKTEFGSATIIPQERARQRSEFASTLETIELPTYVKNLIQGFDSKPSISLDFVDLPVAEKFGPVSSKEKEASPLSTSPSIKSPIKLGRSPSSPTKLISPRFSRKQRSIFTLHLPRRPEPGFASRSTLVGSPTATISDCTIEVPAPSRAPIEAPNRSKGLPSTRLYDLSQLDRAPDDVPMTPSATETGTILPFTPRRSKLAAPMHALRDVKSRLLHFHRR